MSMIGSLKMRMGSEFWESLGDHPKTALLCPTVLDAIFEMEGARRITIEVHDRPDKNRSALKFDCTRWVSCRDWKRGSHLIDFMLSSWLRALHLKPGTTYYFGVTLEVPA